MYIPQIMSKQRLRSLLARHYMQVNKKCEMK
jgi:hypothetical protein